MKKILIPGFVSGTAILAASIPVSMLMQLLYPSLMHQYQNTHLFRAWQDPLMSLYFLYLFLIGFVAALLWDKVKTSFKEKKYWQRALSFADYFWLTTVALGMIVSYSSFQISLPMVITWTILGYINSLIASFIVIKLNK
jgi:hypothetical protein